MPAPNTTRLAGLEIGSTKLAALAMKAQTNRDGSGSTFAARVAAYTAGVDAARLYVEVHLSFDVQLILAKQAIPECQLGGKNAMLGWNTWIRLLPAARDSRKAVHLVER